MKRLSEENSVLLAAEADWLMKQKALDDRIHDLERQLDQLQTLVCHCTCILHLQLLLCVISVNVNNLSV